MWPYTEQDKTAGSAGDKRKKQREENETKRKKEGGGLPVLFQRITAHTAVNRIPANFRHINGCLPARTRVPSIYLTVSPGFG